ncbi:MAG: FtsH protease activity modulator HflK [Deltaproteobacteria bacterium]|jgi:membrane protease subunit HflK|nr:FtsH protease activity modulator HflK [Deltaproteobacteria bacterium]
MNWDWDKLQGKRQRQGNLPPPKNSQNNGDDQNDQGAPGYDQHGNKSNPDEGGNWNTQRGTGGGYRGGNSGRGGNGGDFGNLGNTWNKMRKSNFPLIKIACGIMILAWLASGIFIIDPAEVGVVLRFGAHVRTVGPGPHYRLPYPIEEVFTPNVRQIHSMEIGYSSVKGRDGREERRSIPYEAAMLTGDENIVYVHFVVQYSIGIAEDFLFNADMQLRGTANDNLFSDTVKNAAESAMREVMGNSKIDSAIYGNKDIIQSDSRALLQTILTRYHTGVTVQNVQLMDVLPPPEVDAAFKDLINAREDKISKINVAGAYTNDIIPKARGVAKETLNQAEAYKISVVQKAEGEAARFLSVVKEYNKAKDITTKRMYIDTMEEVLSSPGLDKIIIDPKAASGILPFLPLDRLNQQNVGRAGSAK